MMRPRRLAGALRAYTTLDVSDVRWGDRATGTSLGRIVLKRYEQGSTLALSSGGLAHLHQTRS